MQGVLSTANSRAFESLYGPQNETAPFLQRLLDRGFVVVGKTMMHQFADADGAEDYVDFHAPFSPAGDGYLRPDGSSSGSGAAIATYSWLDLALGTDTGGSIRGPAAAQGVIGMRPTRRPVMTQGIISLSETYDTMGGLAHDVSGFARYVEVMHGEDTPESPCSPPTEIIYLTDWWPVSHEPTRALHELFIRRLEDYLGVQRTRVNLEKEWAAWHGRDGDHGQTLLEYMKSAWVWIARFEQWHHFLKPFIQEYLSKFKKYPVLQRHIRNDV